MGVLYLLFCALLVLCLKIHLHFWKLFLVTGVAELFILVILKAVEILAELKVVVFKTIIVS